MGPIQSGCVLQLKETAGAPWRFVGLSAYAIPNRSGDDSSELDHRADRRPRNIVRSLAVQSACTSNGAVL